MVAKEILVNKMINTVIMLLSNFEHDNFKIIKKQKKICKKNPFYNSVAKVLDSLLWK